MILESPILQFLWFAFANVLKQSRLTVLNKSRFTSLSTLSVSNRSSPAIRMSIPDPLSATKAVIDVGQFVVKHGPCHTLKRANKDLRELMPILDDHKEFKSKSDLEQLLSQYDKYVEGYSSELSLHTHTPTCADYATDMTGWNCVPMNVSI